jgi:pyridoxine 4-dehydrogenase
MVDDDMAGADPNFDLGGSFALGTSPVKRMGYGAMQLAGDNVFGPPRDRDEAILVLRGAVESGINHIDTAQYYGSGTVNQLIREALYPYPTDLAIVSKVASGNDSSGNGVPTNQRDQLRRGIEENLVALGVDQLAAVNLRLTENSRPGVRFDVQLSALAQAREEGLIGGIGLSNISTEHLRRALEQTEIVCVQNLFNLADQHALGLLHECVSQGIAFVPFCPLGWPRGIQNEILTSPILDELGKERGATPAQLALAWLLHLAPNVLLIPGTRTRQHLAENIASASVLLADSDVQTLASHFPTM